VKEFTQARSICRWISAGKSEGRGRDTARPGRRGDRI